MYCSGLGLSVLGEFENHNGFSGAMLGHPGSGYHFEFTVCQANHVAPSPTVEDLVVVYMPAVPEWKHACACMVAAGFVSVVPFNPYWASHGQTYEDPDGYRVVVQNSGWAHS